MLRLLLNKLENYKPTHKRSLLLSTHYYAMTSTTMKNDATYQAAYSDNDLLGLWACVENYFTSGSTASSDDTMLTNF